MTAMLRKADAAASANDAPQAPDDEGTPVSVKIRERLNQVFANHTKQPLETIEKAMERDNFMSPEEALAFGLIDEVVTNRPTGQSTLAA